MCPSTALAALPDRCGRHRRRRPAGAHPRLQRLPRQAARRAPVLQRAARRRSGRAQPVAPGARAIRMPNWHGPSGTASGATALGCSRCRRHRSTTLPTRTWARLMAFLRRQPRRDGVHGNDVDRSHRARRHRHGPLPAGGRDDGPRRHAGRAGVVGRARRAGPVPRVRWPASSAMGWRSRAAWRARRRRCVMAAAYTEDAFRQLLRTGEPLGKRDLYLMDDVARQPLCGADRRGDRGRAHVSQVARQVPALKPTGPDAVLPTARTPGAAGPALASCPRWCP